MGSDSTNLRHANSSKGGMESLANGPDKNVQNDYDSDKSAQNADKGNATEPSRVSNATKRILLTLAALFGLFLFWLFRPGDLPSGITLPATLPDLDFYVQQADEAVRQAELRAGPLKPDNRARIIWNPDYRGQKAPCSMVYLHGFSASYGEGAPFHARTARELGCHLYVSRLHAHGLRTSEPLKDMHADSLLASAGRAVAIGGLLGEQVILAGNSMGGTLAIHYAAMHPESVNMLILMGPLIEFKTPAARFFREAWAHRLVGLVSGGTDISYDPESDDHARYWYTWYRLEAMARLKEMQEVLLSDDVYSRITQPVFAGYYYKDEDHQDMVVSVSAIRELEEKLGTTAEKREFRAFPDADAHVISSAYRSDGHQQVSDAIVLFVRQQW